MGLGDVYKRQLEVLSFGFAGDTDDFWSIETQPSAEMAFIGTFGSASGFTALEVDRSQQIENAFILYSEPDATDTELVPKWITSRIVEDFDLDASIGGTEDQIFVSGQQAINEGVLELPIRMGEGLENTNQFRYLPAFNAFQYAVPRSTPILFTLSDVDLELTNYFTGASDTRIGMSVRLQESRNNGRTFEDTGVETSVNLLNGSLNGGFTDTDGGTTPVTLTGGGGTVTPHTDYMYRLIFRAVRTDPDGNELPNQNSTIRFRVRVDPALNLTGIGLSLIHISEPTRPY